MAALNEFRKFVNSPNTNAAFLANYLAEQKCCVIGVPKTIDGDLQVGSLLPITFGFDTATKIYAELVGNILQDTPSSRKYWHFIKEVKTEMKS